MMYCRSAATAAADMGLTSEQMKSHFGWKSGEMCAQYISTSKKAIGDVARALAVTDTTSLPPYTPTSSRERQVYKIPQVVSTPTSSGEADVAKIPQVMGEVDVTKIPQVMDENLFEGEDDIEKELCDVAEKMERSHLKMEFPQAAKVIIINGGKPIIHM